eukprot:6132933-Amphidinium_carterae.1
MCLSRTTIQATASKRLATASKWFPESAQGSLSKQSRGPKVHHWQPQGLGATLKLDTEIG